MMRYLILKAQRYTLLLYIEESSSHVDIGISNVESKSAERREVRNKHKSNRISEHF